MRLDAFIGPGHVSTVIGCRPYEWIAQNERKPIVVSGFEPLDMLQSIVMLLRQLKAGEAKVENQYKRVVPWEGNRAALQGHGRSISSCVPTSNGAGWDSSRSRLCASTTGTPNGTRNSAFRFPASASPIPKPRNVAKC